MPDPRFYTNRGPWDLAAICARTGIAVLQGADGAVLVRGIAGLEEAGPAQLSCFSGAPEEADAFARSHAGFVLVPAGLHQVAAPEGVLLLPAPSVPLAFAVIAAMFYPEAPVPTQPGIDPSARLGRNTVLGPGAVIAAAAEIGDRTRIGAASVIGPGVTIGHDCEIGGAVFISHAHIGDRVVIQPGTQIGPASAAHLGRVIIQDRVEIGAACAIGRGALGDTVIGEGSRVDKGLRIGPDAQVGRHCVLAAPLGSGAVIEDSGGNPAKPI